MSLAAPIHTRPLPGILHIVRKGTPDIAGDVDGLHLQGAEVSEPSPIIVGDKHDINIASRTPVPVIQAHFSQRCPCGIGREKEGGGILGDDPALTESDWTGDRCLITIVNATHTQRVIGLVFRAVWDPVIEWAEAMFPVSTRLRRVVVCGEPEYFRERVCWHAVFLPTAAEIDR